MTNGMKKLKRNAIKCNFCGEIIESVHRHDFKFCKCGRVAVDGGLDYLRRCYTETVNDFTELAEYCDDGEEDA